MILVAFRCIELTRFKRCQHRTYIIPAAVRNCSGQTLNKYPISVKKLKQIGMQLIVKRYRVGSSLAQHTQIVNSLFDILADYPAPDCIGNIVEIGIVGELFVHPARREGMRTQKVVQLEDIVLQTAVVTGGGEGIYEPVELRISLGIKAVESQPHSVCSEDFQLAVIGYADVAVHIEQVVVLSDKRHTERIYRRYLSLAQ